ncbi:uncharacterized protein LOC134531638 [Bacillus rossius redtenbacheri]|uniref:uncharacterized protein LOC134531638 n=1 Tax=Bacillus rossius redtenbacheri TaxID=93214 RepID=UPI002FDD3FC0
MMRMWYLKHHIILVTTYFLTCGTSATSLNCSDAEVTYRDMNISGSNNKTGVWKTTLGSIKVVVEHDGKPQLRSLDTGYWEVKIKVSSTVCGRQKSDRDETLLKDTSIEHTTSSDLEIPINVGNVDIPQSSALETSDVDEMPFQTSELTNERRVVNNAFKLFARSKVYSGDEEESIHPADDDRVVGADSGHQVHQERSGRKLPGGNQLPERRTRTGGPQAWFSSGRMTGYLDYGRAGVIRLSEVSLPWRLARARCEQEGARLATVDSPEKVAALLDVFSRFPRVAAGAALKNQVYVGLNDLAEEGVFTAATGELFRPWNTSVWFPGEPDNADGDEDCVTFHTQGRLRDVPCRFSLPFFCELDEETTP